MKNQSSPPRWNSEENRAEQSRTEQNREVRRRGEKSGE